MTKDQLVNRINDLEWEDYEVKLAENAGFGFDKIINGWKTFGKGSVEFEPGTDYTIVKFYLTSETTEKGDSEKTREKTREKIIRAIIENKFITTSELAHLIGITEKDVEYQIQKLKSEEVIKRIGPDKGGHWEVIES